MKPQLTAATVTPVIGLLRAQTALLIAQDLYFARGNEENRKLVVAAEQQLKRAEFERRAETVRNGRVR